MSLTREYFPSLTPHFLLVFYHLVVTLSDHTFACNLFITFIYFTCTYKTSKAQNFFEVCNFYQCSIIKN